MENLDLSPTLTAEQEVPQAENVNPMAELMDSSFGFEPLSSGSVRKGIIVRMSPTEILVDIGAKSEGIISDRELERVGKEALAQLTVGDEILVYVVRPEDEEGHVVLSFSRAQQERDWLKAEELLKSQEVFEGLVAGFNRGGVTIKVGRLRGFVPTSQLVSVQAMSQESASDNLEARLADLVGKKLRLKVVELDQKRNRLILSERQANRDWRKQAKERLLSELKKGDKCSGIVTSMSDFGAFIDLGGADGLVHLSEITWGHINHPGEALKVGQRVEAYVLNVDMDRRRIGLSLRRLQPEPWSVVHERYAVGQLVDATVTKLTNFGAFARLDDGIEGLIHLSELSDKRVGHARDILREGQRMRLRIIRIDPQRRRIGLSLKQAPEEEYTEMDWREQLAEMDDEQVTTEDSLETEN
ncbi:MAG: S1 RNA-binding domain-containing protein [Anaerolineae bacterium]|nr:S1 RNA-binding domain-containing protein [Anaerolineae bacterium]MBK7199374.1 S1 RNA-binding domain-containing protein [Anaerolineae bacterium]MBK9093114.1 S1 RNA-binding domain-containing protein [Anaerolineae bacterium]MBK9230161.1 S1 RNA-binding domain-containing protein [Anaerolineae bacterium]